MKQRVPSGIEGLDALIEGGFLKRDVILLAGGTGSGKTIFSTQFIYNGATQYGQRGVYVTFEEDAKTLRRNMLRFGFDLEELERGGAIRILDLEALKDEGLNENIHFVLKALEEIDGKRLVIDSLTTFVCACEGKFEYRMLMHLFYRMLKSKGYTMIMTCSIPLGTEALGLEWKNSWLTQSCFLKT